MEGNQTHKPYRGYTLIAHVDFNSNIALSRQRNNTTIDYLYLRECDRVV